MPFKALKLPILRIKFNQKGPLSINPFFDLFSTLTFGKTAFSQLSISW
jgi:hypothetical protein